VLLTNAKGVYSHRWVLRRIVGAIQQSGQVPDSCDDCAWDPTLIHAPSKCFPASCLHAPHSLAEYTLTACNWFAKVSRHWYPPACMSSVKACSEAIGCHD
jgi:hypothetical protein